MLTILPIGCNLTRRCLFEGTRCVYYRFQFEDDRHALFYSTFAKEAWSHLPLGRKWIQNPALNFKDLIVSVSIQYSS